MEGPSDPDHSSSWWGLSPELGRAETWPQPRSADKAARHLVTANAMPIM
ncbi:hypothetical protein H4W01_003722 [Sphingomonas sp. PL20]